LTVSVRPWGFWVALAALGVAASSCATRREFSHAQGGDGGEAIGGSDASPSAGGAAGGDVGIAESGSGGAIDDSPGGSGPETDCGDMICSPHATCVKTGGQAACECPTGYVDVNGDASACEDIDECQDANGGCDPLVVCTNTVGGFSCASCPDGYLGDPKSGCKDVDECAANHGGCDPLVACTNTGGGHTCGACPFGYTGTGATACTDIDECATNNGGCDKGTTCTNKPGTFTCGDCPAGYTGGGATGCVDINECATGNGGCDALSKCSNSAGSFSCGACPSGYVGTGTTGCVDVNECATGNGGCSSNATCANTPGARTCACKADYSGDGVSCVCKAPPGIPNPLVPYRGAYTGSMRAPAARKTLRPTFVFSAVTSSCGSVTYELQLDNSCKPGSLASCAFSSPEVSVQGLLSPTYTPTDDLPVAASAPVGAFYAWRVRACDPTKVCSAWSDVASLHVGRLREDVNGDGYGDVVLMTNTATLLVYYGAAAPDFSTVSATPSVPTSSDRIGSFIGDVDGDGYGDLGVMQTYAPTNGYAPAIVFGGSSLSARPPLVLSKSSAGSSLNLGLHPAGDFNGDGIDDLLVDFKYFDPKTELQVFYGAAQPANQAALHIPCNFLGYTLSSNALGDLNRDGFPEIGLAEQGTVASDWVGRIAIYGGGKAPSVTPVADISRTGGPAALLYAAADLDGDGFGDAVAVETNVGLTLYKGATTFSPTVWKTLSNTSTSAGLGGFDMNADGYGDLQLKGGTASTYLGGASGPAAATPYPTARGADTFGAASVSDHDGDGLPDLVGSATAGPLWCSSSGTATPTCLNVLYNGADFSAGSYAFVR